MARSIKSVALLGATGNLGSFVLTALREVKTPFDSITVLTRSSAHTPGTFPEGIHVKVVDYTSHASLASALAGIDAVVSTVGTEHTAVQEVAVDAAAAAGVKLFIPSEFGLASNHASFKQGRFNVFGEKVKVQEQLAKLKQAGKMDYLLIFTGLWLDWGMAGYWVDVKARKVELWDDGLSPLSVTTRASIAKAIVHVLREGTGGKTEIRIKDVNISQKRVYELATEIVGGDGWEVTSLNTEQATAAAMKKINAGTARWYDSFQIVRRAFMGGAHYDVPWTADEDDSETMGLKTMSEGEVKDVIRRFVEWT